MAEKIALTDKTVLGLTMRPSSLDEVIGLKKAVALVKSKLGTGAVPRAILLRGPYGCGKTTLAYIIAKYIQGPFFEGNPEVQEVNAANARKLEDMRTLAKSAGGYPFVGTYNVILLDECHKLTGDAMDVLLKELEVPKSPTVWILATTDPGAVNPGVLARCFPIDVEGMDAEERHELVARAAEHEGYKEDTSAFEKQLTRYNVVSPRIILAGFEQLLGGRSAEEAVAAVSLTVTPEYHNIAFAVCYGYWDKPLAWGGKTVAQPVAQLLYELDEKLKKKPKTTSEVEESETAVDDSDIQDSKPDAANALRAIVGAFIKNFVMPKMVKGTLKYKSQFDVDKAGRALVALSSTCNPAHFSLNWSGLLVTLSRVNKIMQEREPK